DGAGGSALLLIIHVKECRAIARSDVGALTVQGRRIVNLKEELQQFSVAELRGVEDYFDCFGMGAVVAISCVSHVTARIADPRRTHAFLPTDQILHSHTA